MINLQKILSSDNSFITIEKLNRNFQQISTAGGGPIGLPGFQGFPGLPSKDGNTGSKGDTGDTGTRFIVFSNAEVGDFPPTNLTPAQALLNSHKEGDAWYNTDTNTYYILYEFDSPHWDTRVLTFTVDELILKKSQPSGLSGVEHAFFDNSYFGLNNPESPNTDIVFNTTFAISSYLIKESETVDAIYALQNFAAPVNGAWNRAQFKLNLDQIHNASQSSSSLSTGLYGGSIKTDEFTPILYLGEYKNAVDSLTNFGILSYTNPIGNKEQIFSIQGNASLNSEFYFAGSKIWSDGDFISSWRSAAGYPNKNFGAVFTDTNSAGTVWFGSLNYGTIANPLPFETMTRNSGMLISKAYSSGFNITNLDFYTSSNVSTGQRTQALTINENGLSTFYYSLTAGSVSKTSNTTIRSLAGDNNKAGFEAYGNSQGTGYVYVGQDLSFGGGIIYNGDNNPVLPFTSDNIAFFRRNSGVDSEVFRYSYNDNNVYFNGSLYSGGNLILTSLDANNYLKSNADDSFTGRLSIGSTNTRNAGIYGIYDSTKTSQIWSIGLGYEISATGVNFGTLYGLAYKHNNLTGGTMAGGHQMVWCQYGTPYGAIGSNIWTAGSVIATYDAVVGGHIHISNGWVGPSGTSGIYIGSTGSVGIKSTASGTYDLYVNGSIYSTSLYANGSITTTSDLIVGDDIHISNGWVGPSGTSGINIGSTGSVGIKSTASGTYDLYVNGSVYSTTLYANSTITSYSNITTIAGNIVATNGDITAGNNLYGDNLMNVITGGTIYRSSGPTATKYTSFGDYDYAVYTVGAGDNAYYRIYVSGYTGTAIYSGGVMIQGFLAQLSTPGGGGITLFVRGGGSNYIEFGIADDASYNATFWASLSFVIYKTL